jgi:hypothetical protein
MAVFRVDRNKNYTHMANYHFRDKALSWKAKGILSTMLSLPEDWDYSLAGLATISNDGMSATRAAIKELEKYGYLERKPIRKDGKIADWEYLIYEKPQVEKLLVENQQVEKPYVENHTQLNTKESSTNKSNTKGLSTKEDIYPFDDFWTAYPKKKAKEAAKKAWVKLKPDEALGKTIIQAVLESAKTQDWKKENGKYIPYPATYLNGKRWEDERNDTNGQNTGNPRKVQYGTVL